MPESSPEIWWALFLAVLIFFVLGATVVGSVLVYQRRLIKSQREKMEAIRRSERQYSDLFNNVTDLVFVHSLKGKVLQVNDAVTHCLGYDPEEVVGRKLQNFVMPEYLPELNAYLQAMEQKEKMTGLLRLASKSSQHRIFEYRNSLIKKEGKTVAVRGIARDVTEKLLAERALMDSEERFRLLTDFSPLPVAVHVAARWVYVNDAGLKMIGAKSAREVVGRPIFAFSTKENVPALKAGIRAALRKPETVATIEHAICGPDGETRELEIIATSIIYGGREAGQIVARDITEQKKLRRQLARAQRLETAGQIAGQIAHDFNNLLAPLTTYPAFIKEDLPEDGDAVEMVSEMEAAAEKIAEINQQLLTLGRRGHYTMESIDLNELVEKLISSKRQRDEVIVEKDLQPDLLPIEGGAAQLGRAISNLIQNAREAMQGIGVLRLKTENVLVETQPGKRMAVPDGEYVRLDIGDTGPGVEAAIREKIFDPFFTTKKMDRMRGSGLGLSIVHGIVEDHNGYILVDSTLGEGTTFSLYFPVAGELIMPDVSTEELLTGNGEKILIVDDDPVQRRVTEHLLSRLGYRTSSVSSGEQAVSFVAEEPQELLILDMIMGGIDGTETYRQILESYPGQKAILTSGYAQSPRVDEALLLGAGQFVEKPVLPAKLASAVRKALDTRS